MGTSRKYRVHLVDEATVVDRGERVRVWFLPLADGWVRAKDHPAAELDEARADRADATCPPGTLWKRHIELTLDEGCPVLSRVTTPLVEKLDPMAYLVKERRSVRRHVEETWFAVSGNYRLTRTKEPPDFSRARKAHRDEREPR